MFWRRSRSGIRTIRREEAIDPATARRHPEVRRWSPSPARRLKNFFLGGAGGSPPAQRLGCPRDTDTTAAQLLGGTRRNPGVLRHPNRFLLSLAYPVRGEDREAPHSREQRIPAPSRSRRRNPRTAAPPARLHRGRRHARRRRPRSEILDRTGPDGLLLGLDRDPEALSRPVGDCPTTAIDSAALHASFRDLDQAVAQAGFEAVDGVLLDLGVSSASTRHARARFPLRRRGRGSSTRHADGSVAGCHSR